MTKAFEFIPWDNEDNIVSKEVDNIINLLLLGICLPLLFITSFSTNLLSMVVFWKHGLKERINACLFTLSLVDLLSVSVAFGYSSDRMYMFIIGKQGEIGPASQFFIRNFMIGLWGFVTSSQMVYCVIALERCLCITRPLLVKNFMSTKVTVVILCTIILVTTGPFILICGVRYGVKCVFDPVDYTISYTNYPTDFYFRHQYIMDLMYSVVYGLFFPCFSLVCVSVCTAITTIKLKKLSKWRETVSSASDSVTSRDLAITRVVMGTSVLFVACIVPAIIMRASSLIVPDLKVGGRYDNMAWTSQDDNTEEVKPQQTSQDDNTEEVKPQQTSQDDSIEETSQDDNTEEVKRQQETKKMARANKQRSRDKVEDNVTSNNAGQVWAGHSGADGCDG
ncbi:hypothetical protein ACOMHN_047887 [Nucella lapillus]